MRALASWQAAIPGDWRAARDFLARRHPDRWGSRERHELTGADGSPIHFTLNLGRGDAGD
jgi:hypothetical protein